MATTQLNPLTGQPYVAPPKAASGTAQVAKDSYGNPILGYGGTPMYTQTYATDSYGNQVKGYGGAPIATGPTITNGQIAVDPGYAKFGIKAPNFNASPTNYAGGVNADYASLNTTPAGQLDSYNSFFAANPNAIYGTANKASNIGAAGYYDGNPLDANLYNMTVGGKQYLYAPTSWKGSEGGSSLNNAAALKALGGTAYLAPGGTISGTGGNIGGTGYLFDPNFDQSKIQSAYRYKPGTHDPAAAGFLAAAGMIAAPLLGPALMGEGAGVGGATSGAIQGGVTGAAPSLLTSGTGALVGTGTGGLVGGGADLAASAGSGIAAGASAAASGATGGLNEAASAAPAAQGGGMFPGGLQLPGAPGAAPDLPVGGAGPTYADPGINASPAGFGSSAPAESDLAANAAAAAPGGTTGAGAAPLSGISPELPASQASPMGFGGAAPTNAQLTAAAAGPGGLLGTGIGPNVSASDVGSFLTSNPGLVTSGIGALGSLIAPSLTPSNAKPPAPTIQGSAAMSSLGNGAANSLATQANNTYSTPFDPGNYGAQETQAINAASGQFHALNDPIMAQQTQFLDNQLKNQGIFPGSEAYNNAMTQLSTQQNQLTAASNAQAVTAGQIEQAKLFGQGVTTYQMPVTTEQSVLNAANTGAAQLFSQQNATSGYNANNFNQKMQMLQGLGGAGLLAALK